MKATTRRYANTMSQEPTRTSTRHIRTDENLSREYGEKTRRFPLTMYARIVDHTQRKTSKRRAMRMHEYRAHHNFPVHDWMRCDYPEQYVFRQHAKAGDVVYVASYSRMNGAQYRKAVVERTTKTQIIVTWNDFQYRFRRVDGSEVSSSYHRAVLFVSQALEDAIDFERRMTRNRANAARKMRSLKDRINSVHNALHRIALDDATPERILSLNALLNNIELLVKPYTR